MRRLKKVFQLSSTELAVLAQAAVGLPLIHVALRFASVARLQTIGVQRDSPGRDRAGVSPLQIARLVGVAEEYSLWGATCLERALVLRWLLVRRGVKAQLSFGARKEEGETKLHAWVEIEGVPLNERKDIPHQFSTFESCPP